MARVVSVCRRWWCSPFLLVANAIYLVALFNVSSVNASSCEIESGVVETRSSFSIVTDYSCLVPIEQLASLSSSVQRIEIKPQGLIGEQSIGDALFLSERELLTKSYLKKKPLLILSRSVSRVRLAGLCAKLKLTGFQSVQILVDGMRIVESSNVFDQIIGADEFFYEFNHGSVVSFTNSKAVQSQLLEYGISSHLMTFEMALAGASELTDKGYAPAVWISEVAAEVHGSLSIPNFYFLDGGLHGLRKYIESSRWANRKRSQTPVHLACPAA